MSDKVKLPKEVAEAIDFAREKLNWSHANILVRSCRKDWESPDMKPLAEFCRTDNDRLTLAAALVNGYEVEQTPEEKVREFYNGLLKINCELEAEAVVVTLKHLNIKISGVNAE